MRVFEPTRRRHRWAWVPAVLLVLCTTAFAADDYVTDARAYLAEGEVKAAEIQLKNALREDPTNTEARILLGEIYLRAGSGAAAVKEFSRARDLGAPPGRWIGGLARALVLERDFARLLDEVAVDPALDAPTRAELHGMRGMASLALGRREDALAAFDAALAIDEGNPTALLGQAQVALADDRVEEAEALLDRVLAVHPDHVETRLARGDIQRRQRDLDGAEADYVHAAGVEPNNPRAHIGLALVHLAQRDLDAARRDVKTLQRLSTKLPVVNYLQALVSFQDGDFDRAAEELQVLLQVAPNNLQAQLLYGIVSYAREAYTLADDYLSRVMASTPGNTQVAKLLGAARLRLGQPQRAVDALSAVVDAQSEDAQLLALLGTALLQIGDNSRGAEYIERAVEIDPDQALLRTQLAIGKIAAGETGEAISQLESAVALGQDVIQADALLVLSYLKKGEYAKAIEASQALEARMADSPIPYNLTGLALLAQRDFDAARQRFELALEKDPGFLVAQMNLARLALVAQRPADAEAAYRKVLERDPEHLGALLGMAGLASGRRDADAAEEWLRRANAAHPQALQPVLVLAEGHLRRGDALKAQNLLTGLAPAQQALPAVLRLRGLAQLQAGEPSSAVFTLEQLTAAEPDAIEAWFQLARAQAAAGDAARARASFERGIALDADRQVPLVWAGLGELELREQRFDAALALAERMQTHFPDNVFGYDIAAAAYRGQGEVAQSLGAAKAALAIDRSSTRVNRYAAALAASGDLDGAVATLDGWLAERPDDGAAWTNLALIEQQRGREERALTAYERAVEHAEPNAVVLNNMAWLYLERDPARALELATRAYELAPSRAEIVDTYGWVLFRQGRHSEGLAALQQALVIAPRNAEIALHVAEALHALRRDDEARPVLQRVLRDHPGSPFATAARDLLARLSG